jgi:4'-phosphopantetheinyl transferase EntD
VSPTGRWASISSAGLPTAGGGAGEQHYQPAEKGAGRSGLPFPLALTLAFSAKESGFKATPTASQRALGFAIFRSWITASTVALRFAGKLSAALDTSEEQVITLCALQQ